jgi:hypothetical protein
LNCIEETLAQKSFGNTSGSSHRNVRPPTNQVPDNFASNQKKVLLHYATPQEFDQDLLWFQITVNMTGHI